MIEVLSSVSCEGAPRTGTATTGGRGLPLLCLAWLLIEAALLEILEEAGTDELATELLECPIETVVFAERNFDHEKITGPLVAGPWP